LSEHADIGTGQADYVLRQGHEMGRPCRITIQLRKDNDVLIHGGIGGHAVIVAEGVLDLEA
jgi:trans-2,3-dihydro-3-hydroxyanthranilate isomerase